MSRERKTILESFRDSTIGNSIRKEKERGEKNASLLTPANIIMFFACVVGVALIGNLIAIATGAERGINLAASLKYGLRFLPVSIILWVVLRILLVKKLAIFDRESYYDENTEQMVSDHKTLASAKMMTDGKQKEEAFVLSDHFEMTLPILGRDTSDPGKLIMRNPDLIGNNDNYLIVAPPGGGKTISVVLPFIFQKIRAGESIVCTDTKASIYGYVCWVAKQHGYTTKFINFDIETLIHSDAVNLFTPATKADIKCIDFAEAVIDNFHHDKSESGFWPDTEKNLLAAAMLLVKYHYAPADRNLMSVAQLLCGNTVSSLKSLFLAYAVPGSEATAKADVWNNASEKVQGDALSGLSKDISRLINPVLGRVVSDDDVDLTLPGRQKCLYCVNLSDRTRALDFVSSLFFKELLNELSILADAQEDEKLPVPVNIIFEEMFNIGRIPEYETNITTLRSRLIKPVHILQSLAQLDQLYGKEATPTIFAACDTKMVLGCGDPVTGKYFEDIGGEVEVLVEDKTTIEEVQKTIKVFKEVRTSFRHQKTKVTPYYFLYRIKYPRLLIYQRGYDVCMAGLVSVFEHPMMKEVRKIKATKHLPDWVADLDPLEYSRYGIDPDTFERDFIRDDEQATSGKYRNMIPYRCRDEEYLEFFHGEPVAVYSNDEDEKHIARLVREERTVPDYSGDKESIDSLFD